MELTNIQNPEMKKALEVYLNHIKQDYIKWETTTTKSLTYGEQICAEQVKEFEEGLKVETGKKYYKVIQRNSVHCFVDQQGFIWKPASWRGPTKNFNRGNVFNQETYRGHRWAGI